MIMNISFRDLSKSYGAIPAKTTVLHNVAAEIRDGEVCAILGPSGSGKSTLLQLIGGLESADEGSIVVAGRDITKMSPREIGRYRRELLGFVFQFYNLIPNLTVRENIELCANLTRNPVPVDDLLTEIGMIEHKNKFPAQLSGGQQQRCAIARALVKKPPILLCDEPTGALDSQNAREIMCLLERVNREFGTTILIVSHNPVIVDTVHHVLQLKDGRIVSDRVNTSPVAAAKLDW